MVFLPSPQVLRCFFDKQFQPHLSAMELKWDENAPGVAERTWYFPDNIAIKGPAPRRFGVNIHRLGPDLYRVKLLWNEVSMTWGRLRRVQILTSALAVVLRALGTDLWYMLEQPIEEKVTEKVA